MSRVRKVLIVEDWKPVAGALAVLVEELGHRTVKAPNLLEIVRQRVRADRPELVIFNASSGVVGDRGEWRRLLSTQPASLIIVPQNTGPRVYEVVRDVGFSSFVDPPVSRQKLELAIHLAMRNHLAARTLGRQIERLVAANERASESERAAPARKPAARAAAG
jgi:AmiR/NasT family two-component response regulator